MNGCRFCDSKQVVGYLGNKPICATCLAKQLGSPAMSNPTTSPTRAELIALLAEVRETLTRHHAAHLPKLEWGDECPVCTVELFRRIDAARTTLVVILESEPDLTTFEDAAIGGTTVQCKPAAPSPGDAQATIAQDVQLVCYPCAGRGVVPIWDSPRPDDWHTETCRLCGGSGEWAARVGALRAPDLSAGKGTR